MLVQGEQFRWTPAMGTQGNFPLQSFTRPFADDTAGKNELIRSFAETLLFPRALRTIQLIPVSQSTH